MIEISAVIPTRNRPASLRRLLASLHSQTRRPREVIIVDASDVPESNQPLQAAFDLTLIFVPSAPSVCLQRNTGIAMARNPWIFLCDDDIELPPDYIQRLAEHAQKHDDCGAVAGRLRQWENGTWVEQYRPEKWGDLVYRYIFQHTIWGEIDSVRTPAWLNFVKKRIMKCGNGFTRAGWPLIVYWPESFFKTPIYSLGANLIRKEWLTASPYDPLLDAHGIGDNYGVALGFPGPIHVIGSTFAYHHRDAINRPDEHLVHFRRLIALHYFLKKKRGRLTRWLYVWSLMGYWLLFAFKGQGRKWLMTGKAIGLVITGRNPYWRAYQELRKHHPVI